MTPFQMALFTAIYRNHVWNSPNLVENPCKMSPSSLNRLGRLKDTACKSFEVILLCNVVTMVTRGKM